MSTKSYFSYFTQNIFKCDINKWLSQTLGQISKENVKMTVKPIRNIEYFYKWLGILKGKKILCGWLLESVIYFTNSFFKDLYVLL